MISSYKTVHNSNGKLPLKHKAITIEFVGPPGAGKTTSCHYFSELLKSKGFKVGTRQELKAFVKKMGFAGKLFLLLKLVLFRGPAVALYILSFAVNRIYSMDSIYRFVKLTLFDLALKQYKKNSDADVVLLDQWIIQEIWSATIFRAKSYTGISKSLSRFYFSTDVVFYLDVDIHTACERIRTRTTNFSRFDKMDAKRRAEELEKYNSYLFQLFESSDCKQKHLFSGHNSLQMNAALFIQHFNIKFQSN
jgi:thymidylate kinase